MKFSGCDKNSKSNAITNTTSTTTVTNRVSQRPHQTSMCVFATHTKNTSNTGHQQTAPPQSPLAHNNDQVEQRREGTHSPTVSQESDLMSGAKEAKATLVLWGHKNNILRRLLPVLGDGKKNT